MSLRAIQKIKNKVTSDRYLERWGQTHIHGFRGVIDRTQFPRKFASMRPGDSLVINLDPGYEHDGTHWTAVRYLTEAPIIFYKDSFGGPPPEDIRRAILPTKLGLLSGNRIYQKMSQENCGKLALTWLKLIADAAADGQELETINEIEN
jgi:hypothetical protein